MGKLGGNYCKKNGHIARLCPKLAAKKARDAQNKENGQAGIHESQHQQQSGVGMAMGNQERGRCESSCSQERNLRLRNAIYKRKV